MIPKKSHTSCLCYTLKEKLNFSSETTVYGYPEPFGTHTMFREGSMHSSQIIIYGLRLDEFTFGSMVTRKS